MRKYGAYKESGIEWIGEIPEHWEVKKMKFIANLKSGDNITSDNIKESGEYPVYGGNGIRGYTSSYTHEGNYVLIGRQGALCGNINYAKGRFWASEHAVVSTFVEGDNFIWFGELLKSMNLNQYSQSAAQPGLAVENIKNIHIPVPPLEEQAQIANYLDRKTAQIDELMAKKQKLIELLKEERTAIINQAVTKGLDPDVPMQDSGIEWLGEIPAHWEVKKLKQIALVNPSGKKTGYDKDSDQFVTFLPMECVSKTGEVILKHKKSVKELWSGITYFEKNDVIVAKITPCFENGKGAFLGELDTEIGFGSTEFHVLRHIEQKSIPEYLFFITKCDLFMNQGESFMTGSAGQKRVPTDFLKNFVIGIPPIDEQKAIVELIKDELKRISRIIVKAKEEIQLLKEYKTALISEVVTGKVDVRELEVISDEL